MAGKKNAKTYENQPHSNHRIHCSPDPWNCTCPGPFTVFAPTDAAFAKLPKETLESLLKPENKEKLSAILTYHVVPGKVMAADVKSGEVKTVNGAKLDIKVTGGVVTVDGAKVLTTDIPASNGVIHLIDTVVMP